VAEYGKFGQLPMIVRLVMSLRRFCSASVSVPGR
jgi:hypothetical protein